MQDVGAARRFSIIALDKAYNESKVLVDGLVNTSKPDDKIRLVQLKLYNLELYINTLKTLETPRLTGGRKTRNNRRKSRRN
jgi:hypothetical protein